MLNLRDDERQATQNILLLGLVPGPSAPPDLDVFLAPFVTEMQRLGSEGTMIFDCNRGTSAHMKVKLLLAVADTPGRKAVDASPQLSLQDV